MRPGNKMETIRTNPETLWYDDRDELVGFIHWYWDGMFNTIGTTREVIDCVLQPWLFDKEYAWYKEDKAMNQ